MRKGLLSLLAAAVTLGLSAAAVADDMYLGEPAYGGTGCPAGSASVALSPDQKTMSILFDQYVVEAGGSTGRRLDRKNCDIAIPVHVPQGYSIAVWQIDYRGFNSVPAGGQSRFNVEYFFAGNRGPRSSKLIRGPSDGEYLLTDNLVTESLVWSACGMDTNLRAHTSMLVQTNGRNDQAMATVDSADVQSGIVYHLQWRRCN